MVPTNYSWANYNTRFIERSWTWFFSGVVPGERHRVGIFTSRWPSSRVLEFSAVNKRVASMQLQVAGGKVLSVVVVYAPNYSADYPAFLGSLGGVLKGLPSRDPKVVPGDFKTCLGNVGESWTIITQRNGLPDLNLSVLLLLVMDRP